LLTTWWPPLVATSVHPAPRPQHPRHGVVTVLQRLQPEGEAAATAGVALDPDLATDQTRVLLRDRETEPRAATAAGGISLVEALEEVRQMLRCDPGAVVGHFDEALANVDCDPAASVLGRLANVLRLVP